MLENAVSQLKKSTPKDIEATLTKSLQTVMTSQVVPKINQFVMEMKNRVNEFVEDLEKKNDLESLNQSMEVMKQEMMEMKSMMSSMSFAPCEPELGESDVDVFIEQLKINELILLVCKKQNQSLLLYTLDQLEKHIDLLYDIEPGLLMSVAYCVRGFWWS